MKKIILLLFLILISQPSLANMVLEGGVKYNVDSAREELTVNPPIKPNNFLIHSYFIDLNYKDNMAYLLTGKVELKDRELAYFSDNTYGVIYNSNKLQVLYYAQNGHLMNIEMRDSLKYPYKSYKYDLSGNLVNMSLRVSKEETFIFNQKGDLIAHWLKNLGYDAYGNVIMTRKYLE